MVKTLKIMYYSQHMIDETPWRLRRPQEYISPLLGMWRIM